MTTDECVGSTFRQAHVENGRRRDVFGRVIGYEKNRKLRVGAEMPSRFWVGELVENQYGFSRGTVGNRFVPR